MKCNCIDECPFLQYHSETTMYGCYIISCSFLDIPAKCKSTIHNSQFIIPNLCSLTRLHKFRHHPLYSTHSRIRHLPLPIDTPATMTPTRTAFDNATDRFPVSTRPTVSPPFPYTPLPWPRTEPQGCLISGLGLPSGDET